MCWWAVDAPRGSVNPRTHLSVALMHELDARFRDPASIASGGVVARLRGHEDPGFGHAFLRAFDPRKEASCRITRVSSVGRERCAVPSPPTTQQQMETNGRRGCRKAEVQLSSIREASALVMDVERRLTTTSSALEWSARPARREDGSQPGTQDCMWMGKRSSALGRFSCFLLFPSLAPASARSAPPRPPITDDAHYTIRSHCGWAVLLHAAPRVCGSVNRPVVATSINVLDIRCLST